MIASDGVFDLPGAMTVLDGSGSFQVGVLGDVFVLLREVVVLGIAAAALVSGAELVTREEDFAGDAVTPLGVASLEMRRYRSVRRHGRQ